MSFDNTAYDGTFHAGPRLDFTTRDKSRRRDPFDNGFNPFNYRLDLFDGEPKYFIFQLTAPIATFSNGSRKRYAV